MFKKESAILVVGIILITGFLIVNTEQDKAGRATQTLQDSAEKTVYLQQIKITEEQITYTHTNRQGSTVIETNQEGNKVKGITYSPYGSSTNSLGKDYTGKQKTLSGTVNLGAREYDPEIRRFLVPDPVLEQASSNYIYATNNPLNYFDPDGANSAALPLVEGLFYAMQTLRLSPHPYAKAVGYAGLAGANVGLFLRSITVERDPSDGIYVQPPMINGKEMYIYPPLHIDGQHITTYPEFNPPMDPLINPGAQWSREDFIFNNIADLLSLDGTQIEQYEAGDLVSIDATNYGLPVLGESYGFVREGEEMITLTLPGKLVNAEGDLSQKHIENLLDAIYDYANAVDKGLLLIYENVKNPAMQSEIEELGGQVIDKNKDSKSYKLEYDNDGDTMPPDDQFDGLDPEYR